FNALSTLETLAKAAPEYGWPSPQVKMGECMGACELGPSVRLVHEEDGMPVEKIPGMSEKEAEWASFLVVNSEEKAERAFGLSARYIKKHLNSGA
ncbi:unnamed protein product, partial [Polarella glacialis]